MLQDDRDHAEDDAGGLEIDVDGSWVPVVPQAGSFVINIGDLFQLWTNNRWRSTPHRVTSPVLSSAAASRSRFIAAFFSGPSLETMVQPAPTCGPPKFPTLTAREFLTAMAISKSKEAHYKARETAAAADAVASALGGGAEGARRRTWLGALGWGLAAALVALPYWAAYRYR